MKMKLIGEKNATKISMGYFKKKSPVEKIP